MKTYSLFIVIVALLINIHNATAQKIKYDSDTVKVDGNVYAIMKKKMVGLLRNDYNVIGLSGTELIYFKSQTRLWRGTGFRYSADEELFLEVNFINNGSKAEITYMGANKIAKLLVDNKLINGNVVDPESERRFILLNNGYLASAPTQTPDPAPAVVVNINNNSGTSNNETGSGSLPSNNRSRSPVVIEGNKITRDGVVIGKFREDTTSSSYSQKSLVITVYSGLGEKIAEASAPVQNPQEWSILIIGENKVYNILYDIPQEKENLFRWLSDKNYLIE